MAPLERDYGELFSEIWGQDLEGNVNTNSGEILFGELEKQF
jgi:hypothetical protein